MAHMGTHPCLGQVMYCTKWGKTKGLRSHEGLYSRFYIVLKLIPKRCKDHMRRLMLACL